MNIYVRKFGAKLQKATTNEFPISTFFPKAMKQSFLHALDDGKIRLTDYVLCPLYKEGDFQIGVTGSVKVEEKIRDATSRELGEELGCIPSDNEHLNKLKRYAEGKKTYSIYSMQISKTIPVPCHLHNVNISKKQDQRDEKVGCFVHGSYKDIVGFIQKQNNRYYSSDAIVGLAAIEVQDIYNLLH